MFYESCAIFPRSPWHRNGEQQGTAAHEDLQAAGVHPDLATQSSKGQRQDLETEGRDWGKATYNTVYIYIVYRDR